VVVGAVREGTCVPNAMPGVSPAFLEFLVLRRLVSVVVQVAMLRKFKSVNSNILSRTVSLQVPLYLVRSELSKDGDDGDGVPDSVRERSKETSGFSLCAAPSQNFLRLKFTRGRRIA